MKALYMWAIWGGGGVCFTCMGCNEFAVGWRGPMRQGCRFLRPWYQDFKELCLWDFVYMLILSSNWSACMLPIVDLVLWVDIACVQFRKLYESQEDNIQGGGEVVCLVSCHCNS